MVATTALQGGQLPGLGEVLADRDSIGCILSPESRHEVDSRAQIRSWAEANGVDCLPRGHGESVAPTPRCVVPLRGYLSPYWGLRDYGVDGQIGAEDDPDEYILRLGRIFDEVRRVLRDDGSLWLNIGDTFTSGNRGYRAPDKKNPIRAMTYRPRTPKGLKPKDLVGIPWRLAFELQRSGWYLRADIIWEKSNAMPESVKDRPTRSHEYLFLFSKSVRYYYNATSIVEANGRNRRTVWSIPTEPFPEAHFATFPPALVEPCILAGSEPGDWVLDPFFGSGTVGLVCEQHYRNYVGVEINSTYVQIALRRIRKAQRSYLSMQKGPS